jgi:uncharacterized protein YoxC
MVADGETVLEVRVAALERGQTQLFDAVRDLRQDIRDLDGKVDRLDQKVDGLRDALGQRIDRLDQKIDSVRDSLDSKIERVSTGVRTMMWVVLAGLLITIVVQVFHL